MTRTERLQMAALEEQLRRLKALRFTDEVSADIPAPSGASGIVNGWLYVACDNARVEKACSNSVHHALGRWDQTSTQGSRALYSTRLRALKALRHALELEAAERLARIDDQILEELAAEGSGDDL